MKMFLHFFLFGLILSPAVSLPVLTSDGDLQSGKTIPNDSNQILYEVQISDLTGLSDTRSKDEREATFRMKRGLQDEEFTSNYDNETTEEAFSEEFTTTQSSTFGETDNFEEFTSIYGNETTEEAFLEDFTTTPSSTVGETDADDYEELLVKEILKTVLYHVRNFINEGRLTEDEVDFSKFTIFLDVSANGTFKGLDQVSDPKLLDYIIRNTDYNLQMQKEIMKAVLTYKKALGPPPEPLTRLPGYGRIIFGIRFNVPYFEKNETVPVKVNSPSENKLDYYNDNKTTEGDSLRDFITTPKSTFGEADYYEELLVRKILKSVIDQVDIIINKTKPFEDIYDFSKISLLIDINADGKFYGLSQISDPKLLDHIIRNTDFNPQLQKEIMKAVLTVKRGMDLFPFLRRVNFVIGFTVPQFEKNETLNVNVNSPSGSGNKLDSNNDNKTTEEDSFNDSTTTPSSTFGVADSVDYETSTEFAVSRLLKIVIDNVNKFIADSKSVKDELDFSKASLYLDISDNGTLTELNPLLSDPKLLDRIIQNTDFNLQLQKEIMKVVLTLIKAMELREPLEGLPLKKKPEHGIMDFKIGYLVPYLGRNETVSFNGKSPSKDKLDIHSDNDTTEVDSSEDFTTNSKNIFGEDDYEESLIRKILKTVIDEVDSFISKSKAYEDIFDFYKMSILLDIDANGKFTRLLQVSDPKLLDYIIRNTDYNLQLQKEIMKAVLTLKKTIELPEPLRRLLRKMDRPRHKRINFKMGFDVPPFKKN